MSLPRNHFKGLDLAGLAIPIGNLEELMTNWFGKMLKQKKFRHEKSWLGLDPRYLPFASKKYVKSNAKYKKIFILKLDIMVQEIFSWYVLYSIYCKVEKYVRLPMPYWWIRIKNIVRHWIHRYDFWRLFLLSRHDALFQIFFNIRNTIKGTEIVGLIRSCKPGFFFRSPT